MTSSSTWRCLQVATAAIAMLAGTTAAEAQTASDRYWVQGGVFFPKIRSEFQLSAPGVGLNGTVLGFERDLGLKDTGTLAAFAAGVRLGDNWRLGAEYYGLGRTGSAALKRSIVVDNVVYPAAAAITSRFKTDVYRATVGYSFLRGEDYEVGGALGLHMTNFDVSLSGIGSVGGQTAATQVRRRDLLAPLPTLGLYAGWQPAPKLQLGARIDYLKLGISDYTGRLINAEASIGYRVIDHLSFGAMYRFVDYRVTVAKPVWVGEVRYRFHGPALFVQLGF